MSAPAPPTPRPVTSRHVVEIPTLPRQIWHIVRIIAQGARRNQIPRMAAALSYRTIFGLVPVIVVGLAFLAAFSTPTQRTEVVQNILKFAGLSEIKIEGGAEARTPDEEAFFLDGPEVTPGEGQPAEAKPTESASDAKPTEASGSDAKPESAVPSSDAAKKSDASKPKVAGAGAWVESLVNRVGKINLGAISIVGLITLIYAALAMVVEIEKAFNQIYLAPTGRSWARRIPRYWTLLTLGTLGLAATFAAQGFVLSTVKKIGFINDHGLDAFASTSVGYAFTVGISTLMFFIIYATVPNTRVRFGPALVGALCAAVAWEAGKWGFGEYLRMSFSYARLYGSLALLPLFLLWVYVTWFIVLLGLQFAQAIQSYGMAKAEGLTMSVLGTLGLLPEEEERRRSRQPVVDPASILVVAASIAERFAGGKSSDHSALHESTGVDERVIADMLERLAGAGILHRLSGGEQEGTYTLARPPEAVSALEVLRIGESLAGVDREAMPALLQELCEARSARVAGRSLADLMGPAKGDRGAPARSAPKPSLA